MKKIRFYCAFALILLAGCAANVPHSTTTQANPAQQTVAFETIDWGVLQPLIGAHWLERKSGAYGALIPNQKLGRLELTLAENNRVFTRSVRLFIKPGPVPDQFHLQIEGSSVVTADDAGIVRFDGNGRMHQLAGTLRSDFELVINAEQLIYNRPGSRGEMNTRVSALNLPRDVFTLVDGRKVPVSSDPESEYQQLRKGRPLGMWDYYIGHSFISGRLMVKVEKDEADRLVLRYTRADGSRPGLYVYDVDETHPGPSRPVYVAARPNVKVEDFRFLRAYLSSTDRMVIQFEETKNWIDNGEYSETSLLRGDFVLIGGYQRRSDQSQGRGWTDAYFPVTEERVLAALKEEERRAEAAARASERRAEEEERERRASQARYQTALTFMSGLRSGFAEARQTTQRYQERDREFERKVNQTVRVAEQELQRKKAAEIAAKAEAQRAAASRANALAASSQTDAGARTTSSSAGQQRLAAAEQDKRAQAAKQAEQAKRAEREREAAQREADALRRKQEAEQRKKQEEEQKKRDAELAKQRQAQALAQHLLVEKRQIRLRALQCPGKDGFPSVTGSRPRVQPKVASCVTVHFEARCPSERPGSGMRGSIWAFQGMNSCTEDSDALPRKLACEPSQAIVSVTDVTVCN